MRRIRHITVMIAMCFMTAFSAQALSWHDALVQYLIDNSMVKKSIVVERNSATKRISRANYKFTFNIASVGIKNMIEKELVGHQKDATKFSYDDDGAILLQVYEIPSTYYNYKLSKEGTDYVFLISVGSSNATSETNDKEIKELEREILDLKVGNDFGITFDDEMFASIETLDDVRVVGAVVQSLDDARVVGAVVQSQTRQEPETLMSWTEDCPYEEKVYEFGDGTTRMALYLHTNFDSYGCPLDSVSVLVKPYEDEQQNGESNVPVPVNGGKVENALTFSGKFVSENAVVVVVGDRGSKIRDLADISPYDIDNITVLKDEDSRKAYGANAEDGVIIITMKDQAFTKVKGVGTIKKK